MTSARSSIFLRKMSCKCVAGADPELLADLDQRRAQRARPRSAVGSSSTREPAPHPVDDRRLPERGLARTGRRARRRAALGRGRHRGSPRRAGPGQAWREHIARLRQRPRPSTNARRLASLHRPGTDRASASRRPPLAHRARDGRRHPSHRQRATEEVYREPRPPAHRRHRRSTSRCRSADDRRGLEVRFEEEGGRGAAESGADAVREEMATDEARATSAKWPWSTATPASARPRHLYDTLFDENAACHIAWGQGIKARSTAARS